MNDGRAARGARIGGRWAVSARAVAVTAGVALVTGVLRSASHGSDVLRAMVAGWIVGAAALALITLIADRTVFRNRRQHPVPAWWVVAYGAVAGVATALANYPVAEALNPTATPPFGVALLVTVGVATLMLTTCAALFTEIDESRTRRAAALQQELDLREQDGARAALGEAMRAAVQQEISAATRDIRTQLAEAGAAPSPAVGADFAAGLSNAVDRDLRPLSRRLDSAAPTPIPVPSFWQSARSLLAALQVQPMATAVALALGGMAFLAPDTSVATAVVRASVLGVVVWGGLALTRIVIGRRPHLLRFEVVLGAAIATGLLTINFLVSRAVVDSPRPWTQLVAIIVIVPTAVLVVAITARTLTEGTPRTRALEFAVDEQQLNALAANREFVRVSRELARYVHGTLQSHLLATAFAIEDAALAGDPSAVEAAIDGARRAFDAGAPRDAPGQTLQTALDGQVALWEGFVAITVDLDPELPALAGGDVARLTQVVEEAISNARKHGRAREVAVHIAPGVASTAVVTVVDDGHGPGDGAAGMGAALVDEYTGGAWRLERVPTGTMLTATITLARPTGRATV